MTAVKKSTAKKVAKKKYATPIKAAPKQPFRKQINPTASRFRVGIFELLQRMGGVIKSHGNGVPQRLIHLHPFLGEATNLSEVLRGMEKEGWVALEEVTSPSGTSKKIIEVVLVEIPDHFGPYIAKLRYEKGIQVPAPGQPTGLTPELDEPLVPVPAAPAPEPEPEGSVRISLADWDTQVNDNLRLRKLVVELEETVDELTKKLRAAEYTNNALAAYSSGRSEGE